MNLKKKKTKNKSSISAKKIKKCWLISLKYFCLLLFIVILAVAFFLLAIWANWQWCFRISDNSVVITFFGILATFVVVGNYMQTKDIQRDFENKLKKVKKVDIKLEKMRPKIKCLTGWLNEDTVTKFTEFLDKNRLQAFYIDLCLNDLHLEELNKEKRLCIKADDDTSFVFDFTNCSDNLKVDTRPSSQQIRGFIKILFVTGPQQSIFTYIFKDLPSEQFHAHKKIKKTLI